jgi:hypothetical protein
MRLEPLGIALDRLLERSLTSGARQDEGIGERLEEHAVTPVDFQAEQQVDRALEQAREHERPFGERRRPAEERRAQLPLLVPHGDAIADDRDVLAGGELFAEHDHGFGPQRVHLDHALERLRADGRQDAVELR